MKTTYNKRKNETYNELISRIKPKFQELKDYDADVITEEIIALILDFDIMSVNEFDELTFHCRKFDYSRNEFIASICSKLMELNNYDNVDDFYESFAKFNEKDIKRLYEFKSVDYDFLFFELIITDLFS